MPDTPQPEGCTGRPDCPSAGLHFGYCLGLYRTPEEVAAGVTPALHVLKQRRRDQIALMTLGHGRTER